MRPDQNKLLNHRAWTGRIPEIMFLVLCLFSLTGVAYITLVDVGYFLTHLEQLNTPGITEQMRLHLEWEISAEAIKIFLDLYLFAVVLLIISPGLFSIVNKSRMFTIADGLELAAKMFFTRVQNLWKWLVGVLFLRLLLRFIQRILRLETGGEADAIFSAVILVVVLVALLLFRNKEKRR